MEGVEEALEAAATKYLEDNIGQELDFSALEGDLEKGDLKGAEGELQNLAEAGVDFMELAEDVAEAADEAGVDLSPI